MLPLSNTTRVFALVCGLAALSGCAQYLDRRDTISLGAGDAVATNKVTQMVDPWPRASANKNIGFNGQRMESAVERYRTNRTYPPSGTGTSTSYQASAAPNYPSPVSPNNPSPVGPTVTQSAAPVK